jgi:chitinase
VDSVSVSLESNTLAVGATTQATATLFDSTDAVLTGHAIVWASSDSAIATVSGTGVVTAVAAGTAAIQATSEGQVGAATLTVSAPVVTPPPASASGRWVTGYWVGYQRDLYPETAVDFSRLTHLIVGALGVSTAGKVTTDFFLDPTTGPQVAKTLATRAHQAGRTALLMVGGAGQRDNLVGATAPATVGTTVTNLLAAVDNLGYDGLDIDWEPLVDSDKPQILALLQKLRAARPGLVLTFPVGWSNAFDGTGAWYATVAPLVDQVNIMSYEMAGNWGGWQSWHQAALAGEGGTHPTSIAAVVSKYRGLGLPAAKLGVGLGFYGSCWRGPTAPLQSPGSGVVASDNTMSYANIVASYAPKGTYTWDPTASAGYLSFASATGPAGCTMISYEDPQSIAAKGAYVQSQGLGGAMIWTVNQGHLPAAVNGTQDPLLQATYQAVAP